MNAATGWSSRLVVFQIAAYIVLYGGLVYNFGTTEEYKEPFSISVISESYMPSSVV